MSPPFPRWTQRLQLSDNLRSDLRRRPLDELPQVAVVGPSEMTVDAHCQSVLDKQGRPRVSLPPRNNVGRLNLEPLRLRPDAPPARVSITGLYCLGPPPIFRRLSNRPHRGPRRRPVAQSLNLTQRVAVLPVLRF